MPSLLKAYYGVRVGNTLKIQSLIDSLYGPTVPGSQIDPYIHARRESPSVHLRNPSPGYLFLRLKIFLLEFSPIKNALPIAILDEY
jgi:hypothetical protein